MSPLISELIEALRCLPGVGPRSAQRMAMHLLARDREGGLRLSEQLQKAMHEVQRCQQCRMFSELPLCTICQNDQRQHDVLCVVETTMDLLAVEQSAHYRGQYFVLMGHLSPLDGIGPEELQLEQLEARLQAPDLKEVVVAVNPSVEGEATVHYVSEMAKRYDKTVSHIAYGVPFGGELEYVDGNTLAHAFSSRQRV